jgi:hypothetical protein
MDQSREQTIKRIKVALQKRSGKQWSVTGGRGTAWGWLTIDAPPARRTWHTRLKADASPAQLPEDYEEYEDPSKEWGSMAPAERVELAALLGLGRPVSHQGVSIPAGSDYWEEYCDRAEGRAPAKLGKPYWD